MRQPWWFWRFRRSWRFQSWRLPPLNRKRAEYGFGENGFKHRTQWVFRGSLSFGERTQWVPLSLLFVCKCELTKFVAELTEFAAELSEAQWVLFSETVLSKQYSARFLLNSTPLFRDPDNRAGFHERRALNPPISNVRAYRYDPVRLLERDFQASGQK